METLMQKAWTPKRFPAPNGRRLRGTIAIVAVAGILSGPVPAFAADGPPSSDEPHVVFAQPPVATRPVVLPSLYAGLVGLQAYDGYATLRGVRSGSLETNPLVGGLATRPAAFWTVKAASTLTTIYFAEQLWRNHKRGQAILTVVVADAVMSAIAARNAQMLRSR
jgi:hypothetical protein